MSALGFAGRVLRGLFKLGTTPLVFVLALVAVHLALGAVLGALAGAGLSEAAAVSFRTRGIASGVVAAVVAGWYVS